MYIHIICTYTHVYVQNIPTPKQKGGTGAGLAYGHYNRCYLSYFLYGACMCVCIVRCLQAVNILTDDWPTSQKNGTGADLAYGRGRGEPPEARPPVITIIIMIIINSSSNNM